MDYIVVLLSGIGLSADAASVAVCEGMKSKAKNLRLCFKIALFFGVFQMLMPIFGFYLGDLMNLIPFLAPAVGWIAFGLLFFVAAKMLLEALHPEDEGCPSCEKPAATTHELFLLAVATSIDAMTVGVGFAAKVPALLPVVKDLNVLFASAIIGCVTFALSFFAAFFGEKLSTRLGSKAELVGGSVLLLLSLKILLENLGVLPL